MKRLSEFASPGGVQDSTRGIQDAAEFSANTGRPVEVDGEYLVANSVRVWPGARFVGWNSGLNSKSQWRETTREWPWPAKARGSCFTIDGLACDGAGMFIMHDATAMKGIAFYDKSQSRYQTPSPRPPLIFRNGSCTLEELELVNPWIGITGWGRLVAQLIAGTPIKTGIEIDGGGDGCFLNTCIFDSPWARNSPGANPVLGTNPVADFIENEGDAFLIKACDGIIINQCLAFRYGRGFAFEKSSVWPDNKGANGSMYGFGPDSCKIGVHVKSLSWTLHIDNFSIPTNRGHCMVVECESNHTTHADGVSFGLFGPDAEYIKLAKGVLSLTDYVHNGYGGKQFVKNTGGVLKANGVIYGTKSL